MRLVLPIVLAVSLVPSTARAQDDSQWGPSVGFLFREFDSNDLTKLDDFVETLTDADTQITGRSWDVCAARGRSGHSMTRLCFTQVRFDDGSGFSDPLFFDATTEEVSIKGFKAERTWRFGPSRWPVAPMLTLHGGLGKISGTVTYTEYDVIFDEATFEPRRGSVRLQEQRPITDPELALWPTFGDNWTFLLGMGVGVTADLGRHTTVNFGIYGMEFPGVHKAGLLQVTFWPR